TGYFSTANVETCEKAGIEPLIAIGRQPHHPPLQERFETAPPAPENPTPVAAMAHRLWTSRYVARSSGARALYSVFVHRLAHLLGASFRPRLAAIALALC
ncbi:MAG TPA: hypothetical protein VIJ04_11880, partial [Xanthobacteraceae bacterium]